MLHLRASNGTGETRMLSSGLISIIVALVVVGLVLYLIDIIPMDGTIKQIIRLIIIIAVLIWLLQAFGVIGSIGGLLHPAPVKIH
jgi:ABC-type multidrug transport system permease subunit